MLTIDTSVRVNGESAAEAGHGDSRRMLNRLIVQGTPNVVPTLLLAKVAGVIGRVRRQSGLRHQTAVAPVPSPVTAGEG